MNFSKALLSASVVGIVAAAACSDSRSITTEHVGALGFGINLAKQATNIATGFIKIPASPLPGTAATDSVRIRVAGIDSLTTGTYTVWITNDSATKWALVPTGTLVVTQTDSAVNAAGDRVITVNTTTRTNVTGWRAGGSNKSFVFHTTRALSGLAATDSLNVVVVSIETGAPGAAPSENRILWMRRSQIVTTASDSAIRFGTFKPRLSEQLQYTSNSNMAISPRGRVEVRGADFVMNDSNYLRPPVGYYYAAYALKFDSLNKVTDTLYMGRRTTPFPGYVSLYPSDKTNPDPTNVFDTPPVIYAMGVRLNADTIPKAKSAAGYWLDFAIVNVTLESRFAKEGQMGPAIVMTTSLPQSVRGR